MKLRISFVKTHKKFLALIHVRRLEYTEYVVLSSDGLKVFRQTGGSLNRRHKVYVRYTKIMRNVDSRFIFWIREQFRQEILDYTKKGKTQYLHLYLSKRRQSYRKQKCEENQFIYFSIRTWWQNTCTQSTYWDVSWTFKMWHMKSRQSASVPVIDHVSVKQGSFMKAKQWLGVRALSVLLIS